MKAFLRWFRRATNEFARYLHWAQTAHVSRLKNMINPKGLIKMP
jgi:hypothetical protein